MASWHKQKDRILPPSLPLATLEVSVSVQLLCLLFSEAIKKLLKAPYIFFNLKKFNSL